MSHNINSINTPLTDHLSSEDFTHVYEPAEDTFLLLDALEADLKYLEELDPCVCLEIGAGSGLIITAISNKFKNSICFATDINSHACLATKSTAKRNSAKVEVIQCNLADAWLPKKVDLLVFNPPYVVTADDEIGAHKSANIAHAWAGGMNGRRVINEFVQCLEKILSDCGVLYLLLLRENNPKQLIDELKLLSFRSKIIRERRIPGEYLYILKVMRET